MGKPDWARGAAGYGVGTLIGGPVGGALGGYMGGAGKSIYGHNINERPDWWNYEPEQYQESEYGKRLQQIALSEGPSAGAQRQLELQGIMGSRDISGARAQAAQEAGSAMSTLSRQGGMSGGQRERMLQSAGQRAAEAKQSIYGNMAANRAAALAQDEANKLQIMGNLRQGDIDMYNTRQAADAARYAGRAQYDIANKPGFGNLFGLTKYFT